MFFILRGNANLTHFGPLSSGIPGFVAGTWELKNRLGNPDISWRSLLEPSIDLCFNGITTNQHAVFFGHKVKGSMKRDPGLVDIFFSKKTGDIRKEGEVYTFPLLGRTLERIALNGASELYGGLTGELLAKDIKDAGGIITLKDLKNYKVVWDEPISFKLKNKGLTLVTSPPPGSGAITAAILGIMDLFNPAPIDLHKAKTWHRFAEASKFGFARKTHLADWSFKATSHEVHSLVEELTSENWIENIKNVIVDDQTSGDPAHYGASYIPTEDHGTCHMNFLDPEGNAVSVTASINLIYGCKYLSRSTGIIMNNQMDDFASPNIVSAYKLRPSENNFIHPGKRPMSSISTTIVLDSEGRVIAVAGASGGTKIITAVAQVLLRTLYLGQNVKDAIDAPRLHHQLLPMELWYEEGNSRWMLKELTSIGHNLTYFPTGGSAVQAILVDQETGLTTANADYRKGGGVYGF
ncbi:glutathione hydrolase 1 proenzyme isoform X2 [Eurytemora carolleeae]|uniref:glutathione hydrolase 1 proenzyme isoform X2 n=1 Tax=Eurytemora carolleeae TaxID=1294199 RepID=UPI000C78D209|nr:glutathione hydrolase 1 proenzyme isoform X2 [Eurytemora carolleeae]|eukprot:XP_023345665.1 glutathione hydrolase 1 proenzyme-like isoform X2 [Eurytemora affinis]